MTEHQHPPAGSIVITPTALGFAAASLALGVVIGWLAAGTSPAPPPAEPARAVVEPPERGEATAPPAKKKGPPPTLAPERDPGPPPADSPFMDASVLALIEDDELREKYTRSVAFLAQGDGKGAVRGLVKLEDASAGQPWREAAMAMVIYGRALSGEMGAPRYLAANLRLDFPGTKYEPVLRLSEGRTYALQARRVRGARDGASVEEQRAEANAKARTLLESVVGLDPGGPFAAEAQGLLDALP